MQGASGTVGTPLKPGPEIAVKNLHLRWHGPLMAFFARRTRDRTEAEDLTQEVFVRLLARFPGNDFPDSYVFQIAVNLLSDRRRRETVRARFRQTMMMDDDYGIDLIDPHRVVMERQALSKMCAALDRLPERTRNIVILFRVENMSQQAIADAYGISLSAVKQQLAKGLAFLSVHARDA
jgi:RNA polymerase sigma-70 factor (ECF subfamily)